MISGLGTSLCELILNIPIKNNFVQKLRNAIVKGKDIPHVIEWMIENNRIISIVFLNIIKQQKKC